MRWLALAACLGLAGGCRGLGSSKSLGVTEAADGGVGARRDGSARDVSAPTATSDAAFDALGPRAAGGAGAVGHPIGGAGGRAAGGAGGSAAGGSGPGGSSPRPVPTGGPPADGGVATCPPVTPAEVDAGAETPSPSWSYASAVPFSCDPMPGAFFFPRPAASVPGAYARCASFGDPRSRTLAITSDGSRVALVGADGIARIVDVASRTVAGVLAPPRSSVDLAAFSPSGDTIVTVDRGQLLVTLWRADTFAALWTAALPGQPYYLTFQGAASFSPDGKTVLISPGARLYLLDVASGAIGATFDGASAAQSVSSAAYGWNGRRIVLVSSPISGMCARGPVAGSVSILDPDTLSLIATPVTWQALGDEGPPPSPVFTAASADLMMTYGQSVDDPGIAMFRLSDGVRLPAPALTGFPLLLTPDGTAALFFESGTLQLERVADGAIIASTAANQPNVVAMSADGTTIATSSGGADLLGIWHPAAAPLVPTCSANPPSTGVQLSADGRTIGLRFDDEFRILRRADGALVSAIAQPNTYAASLWLSPRGTYAVGKFSQKTAPYKQTQSLYRTSDGTRIADVDVNCRPVASSPDEVTLTMSCSSSGTPALASTATLQLSTGQLSPGLVLPASYPTVVGLSGGCPVVADGLHAGVWRACGGCSGPIFASGTEPGLLSADGTTYVAAHAAEVTGSDLWQVLPQPQLLGSYSPRPEAATWMVSEIPVAIDAHGQRVITGALDQSPCSFAPGFTSRIHDVASGAPIDELPPWVTATSGDLNVIAFGPVLWCAR